MMLCNKTERTTAEAKVFVNNYRYEDRKLQNLNDQVGLCKQRIHVEITSLFTGTDGRFILVVVTLGRDNFQIFNNWLANITTSSVLCIITFLLHIIYINRTLWHRIIHLKYGPWVMSATQYSEMLCLSPSIYN